ncbi:glutamine amidotransferase [Pontibacillus halophilus JSM 076056 = DSM 19796]|uniref:Glutamine amidotransferase n=1 Tax=Pontibacillus halophilus JSM 076056 = DSM 19796 TaxID=1385510 RepID=A0A0A5GDU2_9BACI|nr:type 1 glutamine amidotransferase family protein [Pontibacillus halophilus]KGX89295.1 glutamine amidotransferase [Pontibacillus halophilus JSM 076056 = DSM 19796]
MRTKRVYLYVCDTMSDWEYGYLLAELHTGRYFKQGIAPLEVTTVGATVEMVTTMGGLTVQPDVSVTGCTIESGDLLILPGATTWRDEIHQPILEKVGRALEVGGIVAAICGATEGLAAVGYLDSRKHTSNNLEYLKMVCPTYKGESLYEDGPTATHANLITASGIAPLEFAMEVLRGMEVCKEDTLHSWYNLNKTQQPEHFFELMNSIAH